MGGEADKHQAETDRPVQPAGRGKKLTFKLLCLFLLIVAVWAALKVHYLWLSSRPQPAKPTTRNNSVYPATPQKMQDFRDPLAMEGWQSLTGRQNPGDIPPPQGATMIYGYAYPSVDALVQHANYIYNGKLENISIHYKSQLASRGFKLLAVVERSGNRRIMVFQKKSTEASVLLPTDCEKGKIEFSLIITERTENPGK